MRKKIEKIIKEVILWTVILFLVSMLVNYFRKPILQNNILPKLNITLLDGKHFIAQKEKPVIIYFWATWCPTCKLEADTVEYLSKKYTVLTIAVNSGDDENVKAYLQKKRLTFNVLNDTEGLWAQKFKVKAFPTIFIYNSARELKFTEVGYLTTAGFLVRLALIH